jgi:hypothetical protein
MIWYAPANPAVHARALARSGCTAAWLKAGVDNPGLATVWAQWAGPVPDAYAAVGVEPLAWFYCYPESPETQYATIVRALKARYSPTICLNVEVEWSGYTPAYVHGWVDGLRDALIEATVLPQALGFSSVPSWDKGHGGSGSRFIDFPYEAWCEATDFSMPQAYFSAPDEILWENPRNATDHPVIPVLWAVGDPTADPPGFSDDDLVAYARQVIGECEHFAGFSSWRADLATYQYDAMRRCYQMADELTAETLPPQSIPFGPYGCHIGGGFRQTYEDAGGQAVPLYGYPVTEELTEGGLTVQYFERARFEYHRESGAITFGRVGVELARTRGLTQVQ